jgi:predicted lipoprotein
MKKSVKYVSALVFAVLIVIFSLDIQKLDKHNAIDNQDDFNAAAYALDIWENKMPKAIGSAPELISLLEILEADPQKALKEYGKKLGISNTYYFLTNGEGFIKSVNEENLVVVVEGEMQIKLATDFIFGNAVRDGLGIVDIDDFVNMTDFNNVSIELNNIIKGKIIPHLNEFAQPEMKVGFAGTFAINEQDVDITNIRVIPVSTELLNGK